MSVRPDLVACWLFRVPGAGGPPEILLIRRAPDRMYPGLWQCVTGKLEAGERIVEAALREVAEETGLREADLEAVFAAQVRPGAEVHLSHEHDDHRWLAPDDARAMVVWPAYARAIDTVAWFVDEPGNAEAFRLTR